METRFVRRTAMTLAGMMYQGKMGGPDIPKLWQAFNRRSGEVKHVVQPDVYYGVSARVDATRGEIDYLAGREVSSTADLPDGMVSLELPAATYAVFPCTLSETGSTFMHIYDSWLPASGYRQAAAPAFELYGPGFDPDNPTSALELYIPIEGDKLQ